MGSAVAKRVNNRATESLVVASKHLSIEIGMNDHGRAKRLKHPVYFFKAFQWIFHPLKRIYTEGSVELTVWEGEGKCVTRSQLAQIQPSTDFNDFAYQRAQRFARKDRNVDAGSRP